MDKMIAELYEGQIHRLQEKLMALQQEKVEAEFAYFKIINSLSWRLTAPLRMAIKIIIKLRAWLRLQKIKLQTHGEHLAMVLLVSNEANAIATQVHDITLQVEETLIEFLSKHNNAHS